MRMDFIRMDDYELTPGDSGRSKEMLESSYYRYSKAVLRH